MIHIVEDPCSVAFPLSLTQQNKCYILVIYSGYGSLVPCCSPYLAVAQIGSAEFQTFHGHRGYVRWDCSGYSYFTMKFFCRKLTFCGSVYIKIESILGTLEKTLYLSKS